MGDRDLARGAGTRFGVDGTGPVSTIAALVGGIISCAGDPGFSLFFVDSGDNPSGPATLEES